MRVLSVVLSVLLAVALFDVSSLRSVREAFAAGAVGTQEIAMGASTGDDPADSADGSGVGDAAGKDAGWNVDAADGASVVDGEDAEPAAPALSDYLPADLTAAEEVLPQKPAGLEEADKAAEKAAEQDPSFVRRMTAWHRLWSRTARRSIARAPIW